MVDPTKELEASLKRVELEVKDLLVQRERLERQRQELDERIGKRMTYLRATEELLRDLRPDASSQPVRRFDLATAGDARVSRVVALHAIARSGYGSATKGVLAMLAASPDGSTSGELVDGIREAGFNVKEPGTAVRSALKNLRRQGRVHHNPVNSKYQLTDEGRRTARALAG